MDRSYEKRLYNLFVSKVNTDNPFPETFDELTAQLRQQLKTADITEQEKKAIRQAGSSFKIGCALIEEKKISNNTFQTSAVETSALELILFGSYLQLKNFARKIKIYNRKDTLLIQLKSYLAEDFRLKELRNALAFTGDNASTYFFFAEDGALRYKTKQTNTEETMDVFEVLFATLLLWVIASEWL